MFPEVRFHADPLTGVDDIEWAVYCRRRNDEACTVATREKSREEFGESNMSVWEAVTWDVARAGGLTAYLLLTLAVALGLALSLRLQSPRWPRIINSELHNFLTLLASIFTVVHVLAVWIDPFTHFSWSAVFLPLASTYRPFWMAFGIVGLYLGIAIFISTWLRPHIGYALWRRLHVLTLGVYGLVTVHGIATGSDTRTWWALGLYLSSLAIVGTLFVLRMRKRPEAQSATPASPAGMAQRRVAAAGMQTAPRMQQPNLSRPVRYGAPPAAAPRHQGIDSRGLPFATAAPAHSGHNGATGSISTPPEAAAPAGGHR